MARTHTFVSRKLTQRTDHFLLRESDVCCQIALITYALPFLSLLSSFSSPCDRQPGTDPPPPYFLGSTYTPPLSLCTKGGEKRGREGVERRRRRRLLLLLLFAPPLGKEAEEEEGVAFSFPPSSPPPFLRSALCASEHTWAGHSIIVFLF